MKHNRLKQFFQDFYLALILLFLYIPIVTMIVLSFNNTKSRTVWGGFYHPLVYADVPGFRHHECLKQYAAHRVCCRL